MVRRSLRLLLLAVVLSWGVPAQGQQFVDDVANNGTVAAPFLEIGVGARAEALGGAFTAEAGQVEMVYWNPAGLAFMDALGVSFTHTAWLADAAFDFAAVAVPLPVFSSVVAASVTTLGVPDQPVRTIDNPEGTGETYDARDYAVTVAVASRLISSFSVGLSGKYIHQRIWTESARQIALDVGVRYETPLRGLALGASLSNFGGDMAMGGRNLKDVIDPDLVNEGVENIPVSYETESFPLPQTFRFGMAYERSVARRSTLTGAVSLAHPTAATESISLGLEYGYADLLFVRGGYQNLFERDQENGLTLGFGLQVPLYDRSRAALDYAWSDWGVLERVHRISFALYL